MGLVEDIEANVAQVVSVPWKSRKGTVVPESDDVALADGAVELDAVYLYADMADSTGLAREFPREVAAKVVRAYLEGSCRVLKAKGGQIRSFDGDRVMAIFVGGSKNNAAAQAALHIAYVVREILRPKVEAKFPSLRKSGYVVSHCVGVASGTALMVRGGVRGSNDLVSIGRAPNVAAKLSEIRDGSFNAYITEPVFGYLQNDSKYGGKDRRLMWEDRRLDVGGEHMTVYRSKWQWKP